MAHLGWRVLQAATASEDAAPATADGRLSQPEEVLVLGRGVHET